MDKAVRALTDLSRVDDQLSDKGALKEKAASALEARRAALREVIPGVFLAAYDALGRVSRRPVVVAVRGAHCGGCYLRLPPQLDAAIHRGRSLCPCPHCRRLLYLPPGVQEGEKGSESKGEVRDRPAGNDGASTRGRRAPGRRCARQQAPTTERRVPRGVRARGAGNARRTSERRGKRESAGKSPGKAKPVKG